MFFSDGLHDFVGILFLLLACRMFSLQKDVVVNRCKAGCTNGLSDRRHHRGEFRVNRAVMPLTLDGHRLLCDGVVQCLW